MADPFVAEIRIWATDFAPRGWAQCNGQLMPISQNTALFSLLGTNYGGNGTSNFALPNMQGNVPVHAGFSSFGQQFFVGEQSGSEFVTLITSEIPAHAHVVNADTGIANTTSASGGFYKSGNLPGTPAKAIASFTTDAPNTTLDLRTVGVSGGSQPHNNMMPYLTLNFCIALQGIFPSQN